ncbi:MAG: DNA cytosine methyltransferase [Kiritimatiellae bacterium]|nr:DNA cytosine methyltransferase [Kiritimatiellia bacterium]
MKKTRRLNLVSLFSGGGGLDIGLDAAGFTTLFANDIIPQCCDTLEKNLPGKKVVVCEDIKKVSGDLIKTSIGLKDGEEVDLLAGGPPCQAFSIFGQRKGRADPRGQMVYEYFRILSELKPKVFVFENVFGLLTVENGGVFKVVCEKLADPCDNLHYDIKVFRLNAVDYGVPQYRDRVIIVGSRTGANVVEIPPITFLHPEKDQLRYRTVADALRGLPPPNEDFPANHMGRVHSQAIIDRYAAMAPGARDVHTRINKLDLTRPSFTIICGSNCGGGKGHIHPITPREVTARESARIQTFPDAWSFSGNGRYAISQVGNAVPPLLAFSIGNAIRKQIFGMKEIPISKALKKMGQEHLFPELNKDK